MTKLHHGLVTLLVMTWMSTAGLASSVNPGDFVASGDFAGTSGSYTINSDTLAFTGPNGFRFDGLADDDVAVFSFTNFTLGPSATITTTGSRPVAILSQTDILMTGNSSIQARAGGGAGGGNGQRGQGTGGGFNSSEAFFGGPGGGGGFGGRGGNADMGGLSVGGRGGPSYGDLSVRLEGGSGGAGGRDNNADAGGDGGGGIKLAALRSIELLGSGIFANGVDGGSTTTTGGGGGSGGGIHIYAPTVTLGSTLSANGGDGSEATFDYGGGGGGGRILVEYSPQGGFTLENGKMSVDGGAGIDEFFGMSQPGQDGSLRVISSIPEPDSCVMFLIGFVLLGRLRRRS